MLDQFVRSQYRFLRSLFLAFVFGISPDSVAGFLNDDLVQEEKKGIKWGVLPIIGYSSDRGVTLGLLTRRFNYGSEGAKPFQDLWTIQASYSTLNQQRIFVSYEKRDIGLVGLRSYTSFYFSNNESQRYHGIGDNTLFSPDLSNTGFYFFTQKDLILEHSFRKKVIWGIEAELGIAATLTRLEANPGSTLYESDFGATPNQFYATRFRGGVIWEGRDSEFVPFSGNYFAGSITTAPTWASQIPSWTRVDFDYRRYDPIIDDRWLWLATQIKGAWSSDSTPIPEKAHQGSRHTLRGIPLNRYLSNYSFNLRAELRSLWIRKRLLGFPIKGGTGLFVDSGRIGDTFSRFIATTPTLWAFGFSVFGSLKADDFVGSIDVGFSEGNNTVYVRIGYSF